MCVNKSAAAKLGHKTSKFGAIFNIHVHARGNKSEVAKFGPKTGKFGAKLLHLKFLHTGTWK